MNLPQKVIAEDRKLEKVASGASEMLAELRWHWTLDESNDGRVGFREYARAVGRSDVTIREYAHGYAASRERNIPLTDGMKRAMMSAEREAATEAVAKARGITFVTAQQSRPTEARRVLNMARERAEETGRSVAEEARKAAKLVVQDKETREQEDRARRRRKGLRFIELEELLQRVRRDLVRAVKASSSLDWGDDEQELLVNTLENIKQLISLIDMAIVGSDVDWDVELANLEGDRT